MFAYCNNNPVMGTDWSGKFPSWDEIWSTAKEIAHCVASVAEIFTKPTETATSLIRSLHYSRNVFNNEDFTEDELISQGYQKEPPDADKFHQNNKLGNERNRKYVIGEWFSSEIVFYADGTINHTPEDVGTFNVYSGDNLFLNIVVHGSCDVLPYMLWGNSPTDSTTIMDRVLMMLE